MTFVFPSESTYRISLCLCHEGLSKEWRYNSTHS